MTTKNDPTEVFLVGIAVFVVSAFVAAIIEGIIEKLFSVNVEFAVIWGLVFILTSIALGVSSVIKQE